LFLFQLLHDKSFLVEVCSWYVTRVTYEKNHKFGIGGGCEKDGACSVEELKVIMIMVIIPGRY
jgi:hypothetical protein